LGAINITITRDGIEGKHEILRIDRLSGGCHQETVNARTELRCDVDERTEVTFVTSVEHTLEDGCLGNGVGSWHSKYYKAQGKNQIITKKHADGATSG
jgi:hypothetical protein